MEKYAGELIVPEKGATPEKLKAFLDRIFDYDSSYRRELEHQWDRNRNMIQGHQWLKAWKGDPRRAPRFTDEDRKDIAKPVTNELLGAVDNEVSRLSKRNSEIYVDPSDVSDPASKAAAKVSQDVMTDHLENKVRWERKRRKAVEKNAHYGKFVLKSYLEQDNLDTVRVGIVGALKCANCEPKTQTVPDPLTGEPSIDPVTGEAQTTTVPGCPCRYASNEVPPEQVIKVHPDRAPLIKQRKDFNFETNQGSTKYTTDNCLECGAPLLKYTPDAKEAWEQDSFGRPLGQDVPKGCANIAVINGEDFFPENEGIGIEPDDLKSWGIETPWDLDDVKRYFRKNVALVKVQDALEISERHNNLGERRSDSRGPRSVEGRNVYKHHVNLREYVHDRTMDFPMGRYIVMAGNIVLADDDLYLPPERPGEEPLPRVKIAIARCFIKDGELDGQGYIDHGISIQNRINMMLSQIVETRERNGTSGLIVTRGMKLMSPGWLSNLTARVLQWEIDPQAPNLEPKLLDTKLMDDGVWKEMEQAVSALQRILGITAAETGMPPGQGIEAYRAIRYMGEKSAERREQREKEIIAAYEEIFQHQLLLMQRYYREPRKYKVKGNNGWEQKEFVGADLRGECGVKVRETPHYDVEMAEHEALSGSLENPIFASDFATPYAKREIAKRLGLPMDVFGQSNLQMDAASRKWFAFLRDGEVPVVDENLDDHTIHYNEYGRLLLGAEGVELSKKVGWNKVIPVIAGWRETLTSIQTQAAIYPQLVQAQEAAVQANAQAAQAGLPAQQVPELPPPPIQLPKATQDAILFVWGQMMAEAQIIPSPELKKYAGFRAAFETHHMLMEGLMGTAMPAPASGPPVAGPQGAPMAPAA